MTLAKALFLLATAMVAGVFVVDAVTRIDRGRNGPVILHTEATRP